MQNVCQVMHRVFLLLLFEDACGCVYIYSSFNYNHAYGAYEFLFVYASHTTRLTVPGMCVLVVLWPLGPVVVVLLIFFFFLSSSRCSFCLFCTSISSEMKLFFTCFFKNTKLSFYVDFWIKLQFTCCVTLLIHVRLLEKSIFIYCYKYAVTESRN